MIRPFKKSDTTVLIDIMRLNTPTYFAIAEIEDFRTYLEKHHRTYLTILKNDLIVGGIGYEVSAQNKTGQITWIFFDPKYAGKGLGKQSVTHCLRILQDKEKVAKTRVTTSQHAYGFFETFGFETIRVEKDYWAKGLDLYEMELRTI